MTNVRTDEELESIGLRIRRKLGFEHQFALDVITFLDRLALYRKDFRVEVLADDRMPYDEAYTDCPTATIYVRKSVIEGARKGRSHARMTIAHEVGHILL